MEVRGHSSKSEGQTDSPALTEGSPVALSVLLESYTVSDLRVDLFVERDLPV